MSVSSSASSAVVNASPRKTLSSASAALRAVSVRLRPDRRASRYAETVSAASLGALQAVPHAVEDGDASATGSIA